METRGRIGWFADGTDADLEGNDRAVATVMPRGPAAQLTLRTIVCQGLSKHRSVQAA